MSEISWKQSGWRLLPLTAALIVADQWSKHEIVKRFELHDSVTVLPVLDIVRAHNPGAAFSFLAGAGGWQRWFFTVLALAVSAAIIYWLRDVSARSQRLQAWGLALVLAGALGNVIDRLRFGYVVDFIAVHWKEAWFPAFNLADSAITVGAGCMLLDIFLDWRRKKLR
jgi:signal peptidase II